eukprot:3189309-Karenia_brevis.AAC.1
MSSDAREIRVGKLAALGRVGKAVQSIITPGVAADTPAVQRKLAAKFPARTHQVEQGRVLPQATDTDVEGFVKVARSFDVNAGAGPSALRPQFIKEMLGDGDDLVCKAMFRVAMLIVEGRAPKYLCQWYGGGNLVGIGKDDKPLDVDARPIVVGETWRRIAGKLALIRDKEALSGWLKHTR